MAFATKFLFVTDVIQFSMSEFVSLFDGKVLDLHDNLSKLGKELLFVSSHVNGWEGERIDLRSVPSVELWSLVTVDMAGGGHRL